MLKVIVVQGPELLYTNIDQTLVNSLHRLLNCDGLDCQFNTTEYDTRVHCIHM